VSVVKAPNSNRGRIIDNDEIIEAARVMLLSVDVSDFSVRELAKSLGVVPGTIYARFGTKDELLAQLYQSRIDAMIEDVDAIDPTKVVTMRDLVDHLALDVWTMRHEFETRFTRDLPPPAVQADTWRLLLSRFAVLSNRVYAQAQRVAANEGFTLVGGAAARRFFWSSLSSVSILQSDIAYRQRNATYRRFVVQALLAALARKPGVTEDG
jgi:AcrR family transcriptional regulator